MAAAKITTTINLRWVLNNSSIQGQAAEVADQVGEAAIENIQFIGLASEQVDFGDVTDAGWVLFKNFDPPTQSAPGANIHLGTVDPVTADNAQITLKPGTSTYLTPAQARTWFAIAEAADTKLLVIALQR